MTKAILLEIQCDFLSLLRMPRYSVSILTFPVMFYVFFGIVLRNGPLGGVGPAVYMLCTMAAFGVMFAALMGLGASVAAERGLGWLEVKRASPMPPAGWFVAKLVSALIFSTIIVAVLFTLAATLGGVRMPVEQWAALAGAFVGGAIPFCALGFLLGCVATPNSAPAMINLVAMPMAFCSGLWVPLQFLPHAFQRIALALPAYHLSEMSQSVAGASGHGSIASHVQALAALTAIFAAAAWLAWRRDEGRIHVG
jgi:ABC-2 type transport system permease protein